jgi:hypothetical protein
MILNHFIKDKDKRKKIAHIGAAVTILIHAYENYETRPTPINCLPLPV